MRQKNGGALTGENKAGRQRWLVLGGGALIQLFGGIPAAWGAFQRGVEEGFALDTDAVVMVFSFVIAAFGVGCVAGGALQDKLGARLACLLGALGLGGGFWAASLLPEGRAWALYLAFSLPVGLGTAFLYPAVMTCAQGWWPQRRGFATGVIGGAVGLSGAVLTFSARWLIGGWGIRLCFRVMGSVMAALCALGALVLAPPPGDNKKAAQNGGQKGKQNGKQGDSKKSAANSLPPKKVLRTADYWLLLTAVAAAAPTVLLFSPVILQLGQQRGLSEDAAALAIVFGSLTSAAGRLVMPWASDHIGRRAADLLLFAALAGFSVVFGFVQGVWVIVLYACLTFCYSGQAALLPAFASDRFGPRWAGVNYGLLALGMSVGSVVFPLLARALAGEAVVHVIAAISAAAGFTCLLFYGRAARKKAGNV